ncbi:MAG: hypothetical protein QM784_26035 [Polyangiaceae bacterium]
MTERVAAGHVPLPPNLAEPLSAMGFSLSLLDSAVDDALARLKPHEPSANRDSTEEFRFGQSTTKA